MPAATSTVEEQNDDQKKMWNALKRYIMRERQKKKEEYEAEVEEERLRKEREAREKQDVMTLEETKEQIEQLEQKLKQLEKEKQQLFMQLKKVLNEDEVRKRQQQKESNEMQPMKMGPMGCNIQMPMFSMPSSAGQGEPPPIQGRPPPSSSHLLTKHQQMARSGGVAGVKRQRSPSPTYAMYAHRIHQPRDQSVLQEHKLEDNRRQLTRAVLWNKPSQYSVGSSVSTSAAYYAMPTSGVVVGERPPPLLYAHHAHTPHTPHTPHHASLLYAPAPQPPHLYLDMLKNREHQDAKKDGQPQVLIGLSDVHPAVSTPQPPPVSRHLSIHSQQHASLQASKPGSITQGYPVQQSNPNVQNPNIYPNRHRY